MGRIVGVARVLPFCIMLLVLPIIATAKRRLQASFIQTFKDVAYRHRWGSTLFLAIFALYFPSLVYANQIITYAGPFTNITYDYDGNVIIDFDTVLGNTLSGHINFTQSPGEPILCGAGDFTGSIQGNTIGFSFISRDTDQGCGFDWGLHFTVNGTLSNDGQVIEGSYFINNGQQGIFRVISTAIPTIRDPLGSNVPLICSPEKPQGLAPHLIVLVHGCCTDKSGLNEWYGIRLSILQNQIPGVEVVVWDWTDVTESIAPGDAYRGSPDHGQCLGREIVNPSVKPGWQYKYVHFITHSAGSRLIHEAAKYIKTKDATPPFIHSTFLDAYSPNSDEKIYAYYSDYAEQYVDRGLPLTHANLWGAYNFDITNLSTKPPIGTRFTYGWPNEWWQQYHFWPVDWYQQSINRPSAYGFGFPLSFEYNRSEAGPSSFYSSLKQALQSHLHLSAGDACILTSSTECIPQPSDLHKPTIAYTPVLGSWITGGATAIKTSITGVVEWLMSDALGGVSATLKTGSPAWVEVPIATTRPFNLIKFSYEFLSIAGSEGIITVFVDDELVHKINERITDPGLNTARDIPVGELAPGAHTIGFRLDPYTAVQSIARISNIEFGEVGNTPTPGTANLQPTGITFDSSTAVVGGTVFFDSGIRNTGNVETGVFNIKWFVNGQEVGAYGSHAGVPAGQTVLNGNSQFSWRFDRSGLHSVTFAVDVDNHILESNEGDNSTTSDVVVTQSLPPPPPPPPGQ